MNSIIIDCHMHTITKEEFKVYLKTACASKFINIQNHLVLLVQGIVKKWIKWKLKMKQLVILIMNNM